MPTWNQNMTKEDFDRNHAEHRQNMKNEARILRQRAESLLAEADRLDPPGHFTTAD